MKVGFIGLGVMGQPMALNLVRAGMSLVVWNRTALKGEPLRAAGATIAATPAEVFQQADVVVLMLVDAAATDEVLGRGTAAFGPMVAGRTVIYMGTTSPEYSRRLEADVRRAGGAYVEAPVSGSRVPAEAGALLAMIAGEPSAVGRVRNLLGPMCREIIDCGSVPGATLTKLASNVVLVSMVTGLAEAMHLSERLGVPREQLLRVILAGALASDVARVKGAKVIAHNLEAQATIHNVLQSAELTQEAAVRTGASTPLLDACIALYQEARDLGAGGLDMVAVLKAIEARAT